MAATAAAAPPAKLDAEADPEAEPDPEHGAEPDPELDHRDAKDEPPGEAVDPVEGTIVLLCGCWAVDPVRFKQGLISAYIAYFLLLRTADVAHIATVDARFPEGLEHLWKSDADRLRAVDYIRQSVLSRMLEGTAVFTATIALVCTQALPRLHEGICKLVDCIAQTKCMKSLGDMARGLCRGMGTCRCCPGNAPLACYMCLVGAVLLLVMDLLFEVIRAPFQSWRYSINVEFGFVNVLTTDTMEFVHSVLKKFMTILYYGVPLNAALLVVLRLRLGWFFCWLSYVAYTVAMSTNFGFLLPIVFNTREFPDQPFAVGRGFPLLELSSRSSGQPASTVSANRLYYGDIDSGKLEFKTRDGRVRQLVLAQSGLLDQEGNATWSICEAEAPAGGDPLAASQPFVATSAGDAAAHLELLENRSWLVDGRAVAGARVGVRHGGRLLDAFLELARNGSVDVGGIHILHGSQSASNANAFVIGTGGTLRQLVLYDTLFLGDAPQDPAAAADSIAGVDGDEDEPVGLWHNSQTEAMTDDEIIAIVGHELGHLALWHTERGTINRLLVALVDFAVMGWLAKSPVLAAAMLLPEPVLPLGIFFHQHVTGVTLLGLFSILQRWLTRLQEYDADEYAASISLQHATSLQTALVKLTTNSNADPDGNRLYAALHRDHPPTAERWLAIEAVKRRLY